ncbi:hypothetical protein Fmac_031153 [Flemingia macrophylla]|uniref:G-patch domain-containing protein n=1 Tax=Flemingia macrophylla TaxID=520843 RepID=A0ABD1L178_9FABA
MSSSCVSDAKSIDTSLEHLPLSERLKLLHFPSLTQFDAVVKEDSNSQVTCPALETDAARVEKTSANATILARCSALSAFDGGSATIKVEDCEIPSCSVDKGGESSIQLNFPTPKVKEEIPEGIADDLDHIVLKERLRMLLARRLPGLSNTVFEGNNGGLLETIMEQSVEKVNEEINAINGEAAVARDECYDFPEGSNISLPHGATSGSSLLSDCASSKLTGSVISTGLHVDDHTLKFRGTVMQFDSYMDHNVVNSDDQISSTYPSFVKVKDEPRDYSENHNDNKDAMGSISIELPKIKSEREVNNAYQTAEQVNLTDRLNILLAGADSSLNISTSYSSLEKTKPSSSLLSPTFSKPAEPSTCRRKRKKSATDSVQEALEEDAPGLLQVLLDKGVLVDEIKLYGEIEDDEALDESFSEDRFSELETVMSKIFSQRHSYFKFPINRASRASRASYCLACLISLVEQTRYLKFRKWPVEWGWCRDLQSFIFVFERHKRIVLERPEYGYATYFFELVESLPVEWQIKRLVIAMKLTTCSRISIIENKELLVGEDMTEGEAKVLMEYGWRPNTGLGTMLNYRDRVVHDRKNEDTSEWRSKIAKLLVDGYNGGTLVLSNIPKKAAEYMSAEKLSKMSPSSPISH